MITVELVEYSWHTQRFKVGDYFVEICPSAGGSTYYDIYISGGIIKDRDLHIAIEEFATSVTIMTILRYLHDDNRNAIALLMTFEPIVSQHDWWASTFLSRLTSLSTYIPWLPEKFDIKGDAPKRAYDVVHNINLMCKKFRKNPDDMKPYLQNVVYGARYLVENFRMRLKVKKALKKLITTAISSSL